MHRPADPTPVETIIGRTGREAPPEAASTTEPHPHRHDRFVVTEWLGVDGDATYRVKLTPVTGDVATSTIKGDELARILTAMHRERLAILPDASVRGQRTTLCVPTRNVASFDYRLHP